MIYKIESIKVILLISILLYLSNLNINFSYHSNIVPTGDPFSYTVSLIQLHKNLLTNYIYGVGQAFLSSQWYYAYKLPLVIFAYIIPFEPYFYYFINYFYFFIFLVSFFYFLQTFEENLRKNIVIALLLAICPFLTGFQSPISLNLLQLDTQFFLLSLSFFSLCLAFLKKQGLSKSLLIAIVGGLFIWSRGNSIFYLLILIIFPIIFYLIGLRNKTIDLNLLNLVIPIFVILVFFCWYMYFCYKALVEYYSVHSILLNNYEYSLYNLIKNLIKIFINYPGRFLTQEANLINYISILINAFLLFFALLIFFLKKVKEAMHNYYNSLLVSFLTYFFILFFLVFNLSPWLDDNTYVDHAKIMILVPVICILGMLIQFIFIKVQLNSLIFIICIILIFLQNNKLNRASYNNLLSIFYGNNPNLVKPKELENFALNVFKETNNRNIAILFYNFYNNPIIDFYRLKNNLQSARMSNEDVSQVIRPIVGNPEQFVSREKFKEYMKNVIDKYDYLIMPLYFEEYSKISHLLISNYKEEALSVLKESKDKFLPIKILNDTVQLVLLKKIDRKTYDNLTLYYPDLNQNKIAILPNDKFIPSELNTMGELFDNNLSTFYERHYINKIELEIYLKNKIQLKSYSFEFGEHFPESIARLPKNWKLKMYYFEEKKWITIDEKKTIYLKKMNL